MKETFEVRDMRHKEKFQIDDQYLNGYAKLCGIYATGVYISLCRHANREQKSWPSIRKIMEELSISSAVVQRGLNELIKYKIIQKDRAGKGLNNRYYLLDKSSWLPVASVSPRDTPSVSKSVSPRDTGCITTEQSVYHHRAIHSKDIHSKDLHNKDIGEKLCAQLVPFREIYSPSLLTDFELYWNETDSKGIPRWKKEKTWETKRRLERWRRQEEKRDYERSQRYQKVEERSARREGAESGMVGIKGLLNI